MLAVLAVGPSPAAAQAAGDVARGKYVFGATGGCGCHTVEGEPVSSGGRRYDGPFGTVYSTNITPDRETGIGTWTDEQIIAGIRLGRRPNGERLLPVHPYPVFNGMAEGDLRALVAYLRTLPPVKRANRPKQITVPLFESVFLPAWLAAFAPRETPPAAAPTSGVARGEYLVKAVGHCGECHTPRTMTMAPDTSRFLAGTASGPEGATVPNITPDPDTGLGHWSVEEIAEYLGSGLRPDGDVAGGLMGEVIQGTTAGYKDMTRDDLMAIARYLKSVPPSATGWGSEGGAPQRDRGDAMKQTRLLCRAVILTSLGALAIAGCATQQSGAMSADKAVAERQELMKRQGAAMRAISDKLKAGNVQAIAADAEVLMGTSKRIPALFPPGSTSPTSRAKPEIWQQWPEFQKYASDLGTNAMKLRAAAQANDANGAKAAAGAIGKGSCGACHTSFRGPEIKK